MLSVPPFLCLFDLLPDGKKSTYKFVFRELKSVAESMNMDFNPATIMSDFETGSADAITNEVSVPHPWIESWIYLFSYLLFKLNS